MQNSARMACKEVEFDGWFLSLVTTHCSVIIIIIIWHYNPVWVFAFSAKSLQVLLSLAISFRFLTFIFLDLP